jgi:hypothetical protein
MQETTGTRITRDLSVLSVSPRTITGVPSTASNCANPIPDHGGTFLSEKLNFVWDLEMDQ